MGSGVSYQRWDNDITLKLKAAFLQVYREGTPITVKETDIVDDVDVEVCVEYHDSVPESLMRFARKDAKQVEEMYKPFCHIDIVVKCDRNWPSMFHDCNCETTFVVTKNKI